MTILKLLQEMAYYAEPKMDWTELVKKTSTGITSAREYQLLWRHLAYRDSLLPMDDNALLQVCFSIWFYSVFFALPSAMMDLARNSIWCQSSHIYVALLMFMLVYYLEPVGLGFLLVGIWWVAKHYMTLLQLLMKSYLCRMMIVTWSLNWKLPLQSPLMRYPKLLRMLK